MCAPPVFKPKLNAVSYFSDCQDLVTCGLCGKRYPLKQLSSFIKHKALGTCAPGDRAQHRSPSPPPSQADHSLIDVADMAKGGGQITYKSLRSPSVSASHQAADVESSAALADSSGTMAEEEEYEEMAGKRKSVSSTCHLDAATNTSCDTG